MYLFFTEKIILGAGITEKIILKNAACIEGMINYRGPSNQLQNIRSIISKTYFLFVFEKY